jgi:hypothetical protein
MINVDRILVVDDFLPKWLQDSLDNQLKDYSGWKISNILSSFKVNGEQGQETFCTKILYQKNTDPWDNADGVTKLLNDVCTMDGIFKAIPDAEIRDCLRIRLNGTFKNSPVWPHEDAEPNLPGIWTVVYYINDSDGGTSFYHDDGYTLAKTVPYKKGRAVIFPASYYHKGEAPVDHNVRITAGMMYVIATEMNLGV